MKKLTFFLIMLLATAALAQDLPKIAVYVTGDLGASEKRALGTEMLNRLVKSGRYTAVERSEAFVAAIDKEQIKQRSGTIDDSQISKLGKQAGVNFICVVDAAEAFGAHQVSARILNVETAEVVFIGRAGGTLGSIGDLMAISRSVINSMFGITNYTKTAEPETVPEPESITTSQVVAPIPAPPPPSAASELTFCDRYPEECGRQPAATPTRFVEELEWQEQLARERAAQVHKSTAPLAKPPQSPQSSIGARIGFDGEGRIAPEAYLRIGLNPYSRLYIGFGGWAESGADTLITPTMTVSDKAKFNAFQIPGFLEWYAGKIASVYGGPGIVPGYYSIHYERSVNNEPLTTRATGLGIDFSIQGGIELKLGWLVLGANARAAYGLYFWTLNINDNETRKINTPENTGTFGLSAGVAF